MVIPPLHSRLNWKDHSLISSNITSQKCCKCITQSSLNFPHKTKQKQKQIMTTTTNTLLLLYKQGHSLSFYLNLCSLNCISLIQYKCLFAFQKLYILNLIHLLLLSWNTFFFNFRRTKNFMFFSPLLSTLQPLILWCDTGYVCLALSFSYEESVYFVTTGNKQNYKKCLPDDWVYWIW